MNQTKLTTLGYIAGAVVSIASVGRWTIFYSDIKQTLIGLGMGFFILGFVYLYQRITELMRKLDKDKKDLKEDIDGIGRGSEVLRKWTVDELEKIKPKE